ncbi:MAG: DJ-1/PfpI family protein [Rhodospirillales bacterium]|nr:DJ-1/PfpI family protein [Rhodospirillales bacterium]MBN8898071.1 DJ-1/PfpI family protein [Rhodospirillales bacterium]
MTRRIAFLVFPDFQLLDLAGPMSAFHLACRAAPEAYVSEVLSCTGGVVASSTGCGVTTVDRPSGAIDTLLVPGGQGVDRAATDGSMRALLCALAADTRRVASVCTGAFLLAATGLLDGVPVTTHWRRAAELQARHPRLRVLPDRIHVEAGRLWTSAGVTAGIDLALAMIEADLGRDVARRVAREMVVYHRRPGGQTQFSALLDLEPESDRVRDALRFAREHLHEALPVERLADAARLSSRQFARVFLRETGQTPAKAVERLRAEAARPAVEEGVQPLEVIARQVGFADPERMRQAFVRCFGQPPQGVRRAMRAESDRAMRAGTSTAIGADAVGMLRETAPPRTPLAPTSRPLA